MTSEDYQDMKDEYLHLIKMFMQDMGGVLPSISILGINKEDGKNSIINVIVPGEYLSSPDGKDQFMSKHLPKIVIEIKAKFTINAVAWASEAWMRVGEKDDTIETVQGNPKKEVLFINIETENKNDLNIYEIKRTGKVVNRDGDLIDQIELLELDEFKDNTPEAVNGRFSGLYKMFTEVK